MEVRYCEPLRKPSGPAGVTQELSAKAKAQSFDDALAAKFGTPPPALRAFATTLAGDRTPITEQFFQPSELETLRSAAEKALAERNDPFRHHDNKNLKPNEAVMGYGDYGEKNPLNSGAIEGLTDPAQSLAFTLGMAKVRREDDGTLVITDKYQFDARKKTVDDIKKQGTFAILRKVVEGAVHNGLLGVGNVLGNLAIPEGADDARPVEIRIPPK